MQHCTLQHTVAEVLLHELKLELLLQVVTAAVFGCCCILLLPMGRCGNDRGPAAFCFCCTLL